MLSAVLSWPKKLWITSISRTSRGKARNSRIVHALPVQDQWERIWERKKWENEPLICKILSIQWIVGVSIIIGWDMCTEQCWVLGWTLRVRSFDSQAKQSGDKLQ